MIKWLVEKYDVNREKEWDDFVINTACNGTFLQTRNFLNYHEKGRFKDCSIMFYHKGELVALIPACEHIENGQKVFYSHMGSTYGGIIYGRRILRIELLEQLIEQLEQYLKNEKFDKCVLKQLPIIFQKNPDDLLDFCLLRKGYRCSEELNLFVCLEKGEMNFTTDFSKLKKRQLKRCLDLNMSFEEIVSETEILEFYEVLRTNLRKYDKVPVHSVENILDLQKRIVDKIHIFGVKNNGKIVAGTMVFEFPDVLCAHTQYLAADKMQDNISPMTMVYYSVMRYYKERGYKYVSWGIATDHEGEINYSLMRNKEEFGSSHNINRVYSIQFVDGERDYGETTC